MDCEEVKALNFVKRSLLKKNEEIKFLSDRLQTVTDNFNELKWKYSKLKEEIKGRLVDEASTNASSEVEIQEAEIMEESSLREDANDETAHHDFLAVKTESFEPVGGFGGQQAGHELLGVAHGDELIPHSHPSLSTYDSPVGNVITQSFSAPTMQPLASSQALSQVTGYGAGIEMSIDHRSEHRSPRLPMKKRRWKSTAVGKIDPNAPGAGGGGGGGASTPGAPSSGAAASSAALSAASAPPGGIGPLECSHCGYRARTATILRRHVSVRHLGEKPYACPQCDYRCGWRSDMKSHVVRRHPNHQMLPCATCGKYFVTNAELDHHIQYFHS